MIRFAWKRLWNRKLSSTFFILAIFCLFTFIPVGIFLAQESTIRLEETIEQYGRGTYDILVRPKGSQTFIENNIGVVEDNYIGDGSGGISIKEWKEIRDRTDIEIAAPVSSIGYFTGNRTSVELPLLDYPARFSWRFYTSDGIKKYPLTNEGYFTYFEGEPLKYREIVVSNKNANGNLTGFMGLKMPLNYYLLTAIDPESEKKLTGIDFSNLYRELDKNSLESFIVQDLLKLKGDAELIPILKRSDLQIPLYLELTVEKLKLTHSLKEYKQMYGVPENDSIMNVDYMKKLELEKQLKQEPIIDSNTYFIDLSTYQSPFDGTYVLITKDFNVEIGDQVAGSLFNDTSLYYTASKIPYQLNHNQIYVKKLKDGDPPLYKEVHQKGESYLDSPDLSAPFMLWQMGTFTPPPDSEMLTSSPLGIYSTEEVHTQDGTKITPTTVPGSFIATPAAGVTTIEAAELIKGDKPIDAIRIRVAGIHSYNQEAQEKIEQVATELLKKGYEVNIVAGSSFQKLEMEVDGYGNVTSPWTTLGVAQSLQSGWNKMTLLTTVLYSLFSFIWLITRLVYERNTLMVENEMLKQLGWSKNNIYFRNCTEQISMITIAFLCSFILLRFIGIPFPSLFYFMNLTLYILAIIIVLVMFRKDRVRKKRVQAYKRFPAIYYYWRLIFPAGIVITVSCIVMTVQLVNIIETFHKSNKTTLGAFAADITFIFQLALLLVSIGLTIISISDAIHSILQERKEEFRMYFIIGWNRKIIIKYFSKEVVQWGGISFLFGGVLGFMIMIVTEMSLVTFFYSMIIIFGMISLLFQIIIRKNMIF